MSQIQQTYKNWLLVANMTGNRTTLYAYSKTTPVRQLEANSFDELKKMIDEEATA